MCILSELLYVVWENVFTGLIQVCESSLFVSVFYAQNIILVYCKYVLCDFKYNCECAANLCMQA